MNKKKVLTEAKNFYKEINLQQNFKSRMRLAEEYYSGWYQEVAKLDLGDEATVSNHKLPTFFLGDTSTLTIYLISPSLAEIKLFASKFKKVYFSAVPKLKGNFPANTFQLNRDKNYELDLEQVRNLKVDCAFSHHVVEHIHPKDIKRHLAEVYSLLKKGGRYLIICPSSIRIKKDEISNNFFSQVSVYHHVGRYSYQSIHDLSREMGFTRCFRPIINPNLLNHFHPYRSSWCYDYLEKLSAIIPDQLLSILGLNSLYITITK
ncbi:MAG: Methyltransferase type 11 [Microgenomates group bacterium GW2011_GWC1_44_37]|uniref:Methyltransferase type 11 n=1 Tax=Candidatus Collierbacteria bacterium GW2011_GWB2_44_22 TaxID=1618387 RepID=A0A0G1I0Z1_9BACT|nr:MAG: Methyltransferase type 11 [Candidatus Collierbacteria bacterium GW2011_GWA2_44_13]KKT51476.1 MAG: Methyltransferase type 11 [Candidatus Collierbacteria bacterium GW2011_GWB1_44_197]KKT52488.1 MAG: Methyltransferase type 11 [Candidatus Collierbacteria bacterium GW2011_GWB2_44_22]KKT62711.1 MAG: Methyltransferase type 11 [Candidatus Collierbacteria bacterium GW2011_GWD1_44_27]KKT66489.1 MAG: Methyltransferase type 11 [Candidatus Collierbacteria bacterium GW2011_GWC2_44_30]KKT69191.1 MAG: